MIIHDTIHISSGTTHPSLGALIGSRVSQDVFDQINRNSHSSIFGSEFDHMCQEFVDRYVRPMDQISLELSKTVNAMINPDRIRILNSIEDFEFIPMSMEMPIILFPPVRQAIEEGRMAGFDYDPSTLPSEDVYGRLIENFNCHDVGAASDENGYYSIEATMYTDDPELSDDELFAIDKTRDYIRYHILKNTNRDPTDIGSTRG